MDICNCSIFNNYLLTDNRHQRPADSPEQAQVAQCLLQQPAVVRLRLHPQEPGVAEHPAQQHRGDRELLPPQGGIRAPHPRGILQQNQV